MQRHGIPNAEYAVFEDYAQACRFVEGFGRDVVVKADGLTAGKGVLVCSSVTEAKDALHRLMVEGAFGAAGRRVVVEERMTGREISVLAFCDGQTVIPMPVARDHKRAFDGDAGPNTGGMGAFTPAPDVDPALVELALQDALLPAVAGLAAEGMPYVGVLYAGLMLTPDGPRVLEFNCRFGDPETQVILPLLETDLYEVLVASCAGTLDQVEVRWRQDACATVVLASGGYPGQYATGYPIHGLEAVQDALVFHAGTIRQGAEVVTAGGRVLAVTALGADLPAALDRAYAGIEMVAFEGGFLRHDIGQEFRTVESEVRA